MTTKLKLKLEALVPWIEKSENVADISEKYRLSGGIETIIGTDYRSTEKSAKNRQNRRYIGEISAKYRWRTEKSAKHRRVEPRAAKTAEDSKKSAINR